MQYAWLDGDRRIHARAFALIGGTSGFRHFYAADLSQAKERAGDLRE